MLLETEMHMEDSVPAAYRFNAGVIVEDQGGGRGLVLIRELSHGLAVERTRTENRLSIMLPAAGEPVKIGKTTSMNDDESERPHLPYDELHAEIGNDPAARAELDALREHLDHPEPDPALLRGHVDRLKGVRDAEARIANWWDDPKTQVWIKGLTDAGL
jgi:hypothetical protein